MAINAWWQSDPEQRYWMEVATTGSMGQLLIAPKFDHASWSYELVSYVEPGDRVLHWRSGAASGRGFAGWSVVTGAPETVPGYRWQPRGMAGRALGGERETDAWMVTLGGLNTFEQPLTSTRLQDRLRPITSIKEQLRSEHGDPTYFPFYMYGQRQLRAQQAYLLKFPIELFEALPQLDRACQVQVPAEDSGFEGPSEDHLPPKSRVGKGRVTRIQDPKLRSAIENHAVDTAIEYYAARGGTAFEKLGKPYDIRFRQGGRERHVEVKGSSVRIDTVELTINEVNHASDFQPTDIVVVDEISWTRGPDDVITTDGGRFRIWEDWEPDPKSLSPRAFAYRLPNSQSCEL